jgi:pimeloyl-ACP methyl ester carboxylesterase
MQVSSILRGESLKRLVQGIAIGAGLTMLIGFSWGGWVTGGTAWKMAQRDAKDAMIAALAPICVDKFQNQADVEKNLSNLKKISLWQQASFIERGGWATMPGAISPDLGVAQACAELLGNVRIVDHN